MRKRELEKKLKKAGFKKRSGGKHDMWIQAGFPPIPVPRHKGDLPMGTGRSILKAAAIEEIK